MSLLLKAIRTAAAVMTALALVAIGWQITNAFTKEALSISDFAVANAPVTFHDTGGANVHATYQSARVVLENAPLRLRLLDSGAKLISIIPTLVLCVTLWRLCASALGGRPFTRILPSTLMLSGAILVVSEILYIFANHRLMTEFVNYVGSGITAGADAQSPAYEGLAIASRYPGNMLGIGLTLLVIGLVYTLGARMQRDVETLV